MGTSKNQAKTVTKTKPIKSYWVNSNLKLKISIRKRRNYRIA